MTSRPHYTQPASSLAAEDYETLLRLALLEDAPAGDPTSEAIFAEDAIGSAEVVAREAGVLCGMPVAHALLRALRENTGLQVNLTDSMADGESFSAGATLCRLEGQIRGILRAERPLLNFLQYLSGISTTVAGVVSRSSPDVYILDTRKTLPGYRKLAKYAVYCGGGTNHRLNLSDMGMIKDNHIAAAGDIASAVARFRHYRPGLKVDLEIDNMSQLEAALQARPDILLLDNMSLEDIRRAVQSISLLPVDRRPFIEVSGGVRPEHLTALAGLGPLGVSMGYLTHTTRFLDIGLDML